MYYAVHRRLLVQIFSRPHPHRAPHAALIAVVGLYFQHVRASRFSVKSSEASGYQPGLSVDAKLIIAVSWMHAKQTKRKKVSYKHVSFGKTPELVLEFKAFRLKRLPVGKKNQGAALTSENPVENPTVFSLVCVCGLNLCRPTEAESHEITRDSGTRGQRQHFKLPSFILQSLHRCTSVMT